jgi:hypothetical protein
MLLAALMVGGALYSVAKGFGGDREDASEAYSLHVTRVGANAGIRAFMKTHGH